MSANFHYSAPRYHMPRSGAATNTITVDSGVVADITLNNGYIDVSSIEDACAFNMSGANVTLRLAGENTLKSGDASPGILAPSGSTLAIKRLEDNGSCGVLNATGVDRGAGIGLGATTAVVVGFLVGGNSCSRA